MTHDSRPMTLDQRPATTDTRRNVTIDSTKGIAGLKGALRYVRAYRDHVFVVKLGGDVLADREVLDQVAAQLALLYSLSIRLVVVHGGGPQASAMSRRLGQEPQLIAGRRVTDNGALEVAKMVYAGLLNTDLLAALREHEIQAVGLSGVDADLLTARRRPPVRVVDDNGTAREVDFGHVGDIELADPRVLTTLLDARFVPVVASLAGDGDGKTSRRRVEEEVGWQAAAGARGRERGRRGGMWRRRPGRGSGCPGGAESRGRASAPAPAVRQVAARRGEDAAKAAGVSSPPRAPVSLRAHRGRRESSGVKIFTATVAGG